MGTDSLRVRVQPRAEQRWTRWRNGGGDTRELYARPPGSGVDRFDWRVSVATIARNGPFSRYPGVLRTAVLIDGAGFRLVAQGVAIRLVERFAQATFAGEPTWQCELLEGPVQVFNVMVRAASAANVQVAHDAHALIEPAPYRVAYATRGSSAVQAGAETVVLAEGDACEIEDGEAMVHVQPGKDACVVVASLRAGGAA